LKSGYTYVSFITCQISSNTRSCKLSGSAVGVRVGVIRGVSVATGVRVGAGLGSGVAVAVTAGPGVALGHMIVGRGSAGLGVVICAGRLHASILDISRSNTKERYLGNFNIA